jgi:murein DD-endopeptidase MepM/ murein hydrolase activator NlpD
MSNLAPRLRRLGLVAAVIAAAGLAAPSVASAARDPWAKGQEDLANARAAATDAARRYAEAQTEQARQEIEIARLEKEIPVLRARADKLKEEVRLRAAQLYTEGNLGQLQRLLSTSDVVEAARMTELTSTSAEHDRELAGELNRTAKKLEREQAELKTRKAAQDALVAELAKQHELLDIALAAADAAMKNLEAIAKSQQEFAGAAGAAAGQVATGAAVCPVAGPVVFTNDWGAPRSGGRTHKGNDMFASIGTPDVAVVDGYLRYNIGGLGGIGVVLEGDDGNSYYYAHLSRIEGPERRVHRAEVIGYVGDTGNAAGGPPHTHFEIWPGGGAPVNPYPTIRVLCPQ